MNKYTVICLLVAIFTGALGRSVTDDLKQFEDFKLTYGRSYAPSEDVARFGCFRRILDLIEKRNAGSSQEVHAVNQFSDICPEDFAATMHGYKPKNSTVRPASMYSESEIIAGQSINWAQKGAVTPIKNQGQCGSCWSFSATGNMEGQWFLSGKSLVGLSEEELVECSHNNDFGCKGGIMDNAFQWVIQNGGINSEAAYPYTSGFGVNGQCKEAKTKVNVAKFSSYKNLPHNENEMATWSFSNGPVSIAVDALTWQTYSGGVMSNCFGRQLDHGVLIAGFDQTASPPYWIVKNSWGTSWGENGYIRLEFGTNQCGITEDPCTSVV